VRVSSWRYRALGDGIGQVSVTTVCRLVSSEARNARTAVDLPLPTSPVTTAMPRSRTVSASRAWSSFTLAVATLRVSAVLKVRVKGTLCRL